MKKTPIILCVCILLAIPSLNGCINAPPESSQCSIESLNVEPGIINLGESTNLSWSVIGATSVNIDNGIGSVVLVGYRMIEPMQTTTYLLTASNATVTKTATVTVIVENESNASQDNEEIIIFSFEVTPSVIDQGESANLSWVVIGATSVHINNGIGEVLLSGKQLVTPSETTTYTLNASNSSMSKQINVTLYVQPEQQPPYIICASDADTNRIIVTYTDADVTWSDIAITTNVICDWEIYYNGGTTGAGIQVTPMEEISIGDYIEISGTEGVVILKFRYIPTETEIGVWTVLV